MYIGIDIGTTSTTGLLFDIEGVSHCKSSVGYPINSPEPRFREQGPDEIFEAVLKVISDLSNKSKELGKEIEFISFSTMMHSLIAVDEDGNPLTQCIIWADSRSHKYAEDFEQSGKGIEIYKRTGTPCHPMSPLYKIMWIRDKETDIFNNTYKFISIKEYIFYQLFDKYLVDHSMASATGLFNLKELDWDEEALSLAGIDESKLSKPVETTRVVSGLKDEYIDKLDLDKETKFIIGATDGCLANLGSNGIESGTAVITIGTSGAVRVVSDEPKTDDLGRTFSYILTDDRYVLGGPINNGGMVYRWFMDNFSSEEIREAKEKDRDVYDLLNELIGNVKPGSNGLIFHPFLTGERAPYWNANLRGSYIGISDNHERADFARALLEGISFAIKDVLLVLEDLVGDVESIYVNGGFTKSKEWLEILSSVLDKSLNVSDNYESPSLGAVMLGLLATGKVDDLSELSYMLDKGNTYHPIEDRRIYDELFNIYKESIVKLTGIYEKISYIQES